MDFQKFEKVLNKEAKVMEEIEALFITKKEALIKSKLDTLFDIDEKINNLTQKAQEIQQQRLAISDESLSQIIHKIQNQDKRLAKNIHKIKEDIEQKTGNIRKLSILHIELIQHGIKMVDGTIRTIIKAVTPQTNNYNNLGKTSTINTGRVSSVIETV